MSMTVLFVLQTCIEYRLQRLETFHFGYTQFLLFTRYQTSTIAIELVCFGFLFVEIQNYKHFV